MVTKEQFEKRIEQLCAMEKGWLNGEGGKFNKESFNYIKERLFDANDRLSIPLPYLYPTPINNIISLEWDDSTEFEFNLKTKKVNNILIDDLKDKELWGFILSLMGEGV